MEECKYIRGWRADRLDEARPLYLVYRHLQVLLEQVGSGGGLSVLR